MTIQIGQTLPDATVSMMGTDGPEQMALADKFRGRTVVVFGLPGAFTGTCSTLHLPSFMRTKTQFDAKGVDEIICVSVNDAWVMDAWGKATAATDAGITLVADHTAEFTKAIGMNFDAPAVGFFDRSRRYAMVVKDGVVTHLQIDKPGVCDATTGEGILAAM